MSSPLARPTATLIGFTAVLLWSLLAFLTAASGTMPAFQLTAITFAIGGLSLLVLRPGALKAMRQPLPVWLLGVGGLFGYHFVYFFALRNAPPVEAGLINYLWPLLIVVFSALLPGERLKWQHIAGCVLALAGAVLVVTRGQGFGFDPQYALGYGAALFAALAWSTYSVLSRRFAHVPSDAIAGFCLVTAALAAICHMLLETTVWPANAWQWASVVGLGLGPVGLAFYVWDIGVKQGDIQILGAASYSAPLLSTLILIATGYAAYSNTILVACLLITAGAVVAAKDMLFRRPAAAR
ncbi:EamA family transporter [Devosia sp. ZB163]|uniref:aromatic amino acid exporter YddG n=1 Tax=Devosia sp. ZB163 TaxID=3025938 RepID=UPI00235E03FF|nr:EamA family transporter [Devosia sp. ZB163]MDC9825741.1 EamA family transporter [Devosia sp. ZB163]